MSDDGNSHIQIILLLQQYLYYFIILSNINHSIYYIHYIYIYFIFSKFIHSLLSIPSYITYKFILSQLYPFISLIPIFLLIYFHYPLHPKPYQSLFYYSITYSCTTLYPTPHIFPFIFLSLFTLKFKKKN